MIIKYVLIGMKKGLFAPLLLMRVGRDSDEIGQIKLLPIDSGHQRCRNY